MGSPVLRSGLLAEAETLQKFVILRQVVAFEIVEELATAGGHLKQAAAAVEIFAVCAQVLGQVIDASGEQRDLDLGRPGVGVVDFVFGNDFGFGDR